MDDLPILTQEELKEDAGRESLARHLLSQDLEKDCVGRLLGIDSDEMLGIQQSAMTGDPGPAEVRAAVSEIWIGKLEQQQEERILDKEIEKKRTAYMHIYNRKSRPRVDRAADRGRLTSAQRTARSPFRASKIKENERI